MSKITWFGHSAFKVESDDASVLIDPFFAPGSGFTWRDAGKPDLVLVTHDHGDHVGDAVAICRETGAMLGCVVGTAAKMANLGVPERQILNGIGFNIGGTMEYKGMAATMTQAFHSSDSGANGLHNPHAGWACAVSCRRYGDFFHLVTSGKAIPHTACPAANWRGFHDGWPAGCQCLQTAWLPPGCAHALGNISGAGSKPR